MTKKPPFYELSKLAELDLEDIFDFTVQEFGLDQAVVYVSAFEEIFEFLSQSPKLGRDRPEVRAGLKSFAQKSHIIFYRIKKNRIRIVRILHGNSDLPRHF